MSLRFVVGICLLSSCVLACTKPNHDDSDPNSSSHLARFTVSVLERTPATAIIKWDSSKNNISSELVKYRIILDNKVVKDNLTRLTDTLTALEKGKTYTGKVVAFITGDTTFSEFSLSTYEGQLYAYTSDEYSLWRFGCFNAYPVPGVQNQPSMWRFNARNVIVPTLSNDTLFMVVNDKLQAVNATTGSTIWQAPVDSSFSTAVTYVAGRLYICSNTGTLVCLNSGTGQPLWSYGYGTFNTFFNSVPVVDNNMVIVSPVNHSVGEIHAVNALTGQKIWSYNINYSICDRPLATKGVVVINSGMAGLALALDESTGHLLWSKTDLGKVGMEQFDPVYVDGKVLVGTIGTVYALDLKTGAGVWQYESGNRASFCVAGNDMVYLCKDSVDMYYGYYTIVKGISAKDGHLVWSRGGEAASMYYSDLVFAKDRLYGVFKASYVTAALVTFSATTGSTDISFANNNPVTLNLYEGVRNFIIRRDGVVYYPSSHGNYQ
jgi:outer membrane protein assembly factor BamB